MKKINFEGLPSTNTPISPDNLNQMQSNIEESIMRNIVTVGLSADQSFSTTASWENVTILFNTISKVGGKLSLQDNKYVVIGKGVSKISIECNVRLGEVLTGTSQLLIRKNENIIGNRSSIKYSDANAQFHVHSLTRQIISVTEGDLISLGFNFSTGALIDKLIMANSTWMTIEVLE